jgi:hypothetical protein
MDILAGFLSDYVKQSIVCKNRKYLNAIPVVNQTMGYCVAAREKVFAFACAVILPH